MEWLPSSWQGVMVSCMVSMLTTAVASAPGTPPQHGDVNRGKYLVEEVARCGECHSPRDAAGNLDRSRWLQGAPIWIQPVAPIRDWAERAPPLAGLPGLTQSQLERVLETGLDIDGKPLRLPMHPYHLARADAEAMAAYLKSLPEASSH